MFFFKYQGTGNDFIMLDNRQDEFNQISKNDVQKLCHRKFGIGADGLILINKHADFDFEMLYFNADGSTSFCGNGARCAVAFANALGIIQKEACFLASDGKHKAIYNEGLVALQMADVSGIERRNDSFILDTGSPHFVCIREELDQINVVKEGRSIRYNDEFALHGINVNFIDRIDDSRIRVRTYERGVEDETLSCGTGATAAALVHGLLNKKTGESSIHVRVEGGELLVKFESQDGELYTNIQLIGAATFVFKGEIDG